MLYTIVTGGSSGIGLSIVKNILQNKSRGVIIIDKNPPKDFKKELTSKKLIFLQFDFLQSSNLLTFLCQSNLQKIKIDHLVNNAGYQENKDILKISLNEFKSMYEVIVNSPFVLMQRYIQHFLKHNISKGSITNITSIHSHIIREIAHYSSAKAALDMLSKEMAYKLSKYNITVNCVAPGSIFTSLLEQDLSTPDLLSTSANLIPLGHHGTPQDIANTVLFLQSSQASYITGTRIVIDGGLSLVI